MPDDMDPLQRALDSMNREAVEAWVSKNAPELGGITQRVRRSRLLVMQWSSTEQRNDRNAFFATVANMLRNNGNADAHATVTHLVEGANVFERAYDEMRAALADSELAKCTLPEQIWGWVGKIGAFSNDLKTLLEQYIKETKAVVDPTAMQVPDSQGNMFNPDAAWGLVVEVVSGALQMLGHANKLFDSNGTLLVPPLVRFGSPTNTADPAWLAGASWHAVEGAEERWRWFGGEVAVETHVNPDDKSQTAEVLRYSREMTEFELLNEIAEERLRRLMDKTRMEGENDGANGANLVLHALTARVPLMPRAFLTKEELLSARVLSMLLKLDVSRETKEYAGLTLSEWLRGYARLQQIAEHAASSGKVADGLFSLRLSEAASDLRLVGLTDAKAQRFLRCVCLGKRSDDLFDTPLLLSANGMLHLIVPIIEAFNIPRLVLSQLRVLKEPIGRKGKGLEKFVQDRLTEFGVPCRGFKFKEEGEQYEYDAACVWQNTLFIFECKNHSFPGRGARRLSEFATDLADHLSQVKRLADAGNKYPQRIREHLGNVSWTRTIPCVLNGLPWSAGKIDNAYVYDSSALVRFFQDGWLMFALPKGATAEIAAIWKSCLGSLWSDTAPTANDLARQIEDPWQVKIHLQEFAVIEPAIPLSRRMFFTRPKFLRLPPSVRRSLRSAGLDGEELEKLAAAYEPSPEAQH